MITRPIRTLLLVAALAQGLTTMLVLRHGGQRVPDTASYERSVPQLLEHGSFDRLPGVPETIRTPGLPLVLAPLYAVFGAGPIGVLVVQWLARLLLVFAVYRVTADVLGNRAAWIAGLLTALDPVALLAGSTIETETIFTLLLFLSVWACVRVPAARLALVSAVLIIAATYVRPISYFLPPLLALWLLWRWPKRFALLYLAVVVVGVGAWQVRNYRRAGLSSFASISEINLYFYRAAGVIALREHRPLEAVQAEMGYTRPEFVSAAPPDTVNAWGTRAKSILLRDPVATIRTQVAGVLRTLFGPGLGTARDSVGASLARVWAALSLLHVMLVYAGILALWRYRIPRQETMLLVPFAIAAIYLVLIGAGPEALSRFRVPVMPFLATFAGAGIAMASQRFLSRRGGTPTASASA